MSGVLLDATGRRLLQSGGKVVLDDGAGNDCCCEGGGTYDPNCPFCPTFPSTVTVTLSGYSLCACVWHHEVDANGNYRVVETNIDVNGTYTLTRNAFPPCSFSTTAAVGTVTYKASTTEDYGACSGAGFFDISGFPYFITGSKNVTLRIDVNFENDSSGDAKILVLAWIDDDHSSNGWFEQGTIIGHDVPASSGGASFPYADTNTAREILTSACTGTWTENLTWPLCRRSNETGYEVYQTSGTYTLTASP